MKRTVLACGLGILIACLGAGLASAGNQGKQVKQKGRSGEGSAQQHRSERAQERSNAQWSEGATRGRERADEVRSDRAKQKDRSEKGAGRQKGAGREEEARQEKEARREREKGAEREKKAGRDKRDAKPGDGIPATDEIDEVVPTDE